MIYTFQKRKELNKLLREALPDYGYTEDREGVPRMRMDRLPVQAEPVDNTHSLELMAYRYWERCRKPMPVFLTPKTRMTGENECIDVNYVSHRSDKSLALAGKYIGEGRLYAIEWNDFS